MAINPEHIPLYQEVFEFLRQNLGGVPRALIVGYQEILPDSRKTYPFEDVRQLFQSWGIESHHLDLFDIRASEVDLNQGLPPLYSRLFDLVFDIGTLEHIADSQQALENYLYALKVGGYLFLLTPCKGYFDHGLHTFSPEYILETLRENGCEIEKKWFVLPEWEGGKIIPGVDLLLKAIHEDVLIVVIAKLVREFHRPIKPIQQARWKK
jgi:SAM-dependent methyltransferase